MTDKTKKNYKKIKELNYLELTPVCLHQHEINDKGLVDVLVPKFKSKFANKFFIPGSKSQFIKANLDELGSAVWLTMDGNNRVETISGLMDEKFGEKIKPVNERLTTFLTELYRNGFISFKEL
jgi:hypothetical protein